MVTADSLGHVNDSGEVPWWSGPGEYEGPGLSGGLGMIRIPTGGWASATCDGTVTVHFHWIPDNISPPDHQWVQVQAGARWSGNATSVGTAGEPLDDPIIDFSYGQSQGGSHVVRKSVTGRDFYMTYRVFATVSGIQSGILSLGCGVAAEPTSRWIDLDLVGASGHSMRFLTGGTRSLRIPSNVVEGEFIDLPYPEAISVPVSESSDDVTVSKQIDYGWIPPVLYAPDIPNDKYLQFQGYRSSEQTPTESYAYSLSKAWVAPTETLPSGLFQNGWDILAAVGRYDGPYFDSAYHPTRYASADDHYAEQVKFVYTWSDGTIGNATLNIQFHPNVDNEVSLGTWGYRWPSDPEFPFELESHQEWTPIGATSANVIYEHPPINKEVVAAGPETLVGFIDLFEPVPAAVELIATVLGVILNIDYPGDTVASLPRGGFDDADANGRVSPSDWRAHWHPSGKDNDLLSHAKWKAKWKQGKNVRFSVADTWDASGYSGQKQFATEYPEAMFESRRLYWYVFTSF